MPKCDFNKVSIKLQSNFIEIAFRYGCSPVNLLHIFRMPFQQNTSKWLLLVILQNKEITVVELFAWLVSIIKALQNP